MPDSVLGSQPSRVSVARCPAALALALGLFAAAALPGAASAEDQFTPAEDGWKVYVNDRFGTSFVFPAELFTPEAAPENGDGRRFVAHDANLEIYAWDNTDGENAESLKRRLVGSEGYHDVTYSPSGRNWLVISGYRGENIFYEKYFFRADVVHGFGMEFPREAKPRYAPIIERIEDSFRAG
jgi:hypothetical protein